MYLWAVQWPTQTIRKEVHGQMKEVEVVGGHAEFRTLAAAEQHARRLEAFWPGLSLWILPATPEKAPVHAEAGPGLSGVSNPKRDAFGKRTASLALAEA